MGCLLRFLLLLAVSCNLCKSLQDATRGQLWLMGKPTSFHLVHKSSIETVFCLKSRAEFDAKSILKEFFVARTYGVAKRFWRILSGEGNFPY